MNPNSAAAHSIVKVAQRHYQADSDNKLNGRTDEPVHLTHLRVCSMLFKSNAQCSLLFRVAAVAAAANVTRYGLKIKAKTAFHASIGSAGVRAHCMI